MEWDEVTITNDESRGLSVIFSDCDEDPYVMEITERFDGTKEETVRITHAEFYRLMQEWAARKVSASNRRGQK